MFCTTHLVLSGLTVFFLISLFVDCPHSSLELVSYFAISFTRRDLSARDIGREVDDRARSLVKDKPTRNEEI